jgi:hypothetical protein
MSKPSSSKAKDRVVEQRLNDTNKEHEQTTAVDGTNNGVDEQDTMDKMQ